MIPPFPSGTFYVDVTTSDVTYPDGPVTVDADASTLAGKAYTVLLSFKGYEVSTQASVSEWDDTGAGSGIVTDQPTN